MGFPEVRLVPTHPITPPNNYAKGFVSGALTEERRTITQFNPDICFFCSDATVGATRKVFVADGKLKGEFPSGMGGSDYTLTLADPSDSLIYAGATFNPQTLEIDSRFLGVSGSGDYPESRVETVTSGFLYWLLAFTYFDVDGDFRITMARLGNINFEPSYGSLNGQPALYIDPEIGFLDLLLM